MAFVANLFNMYPCLPPVEDMEEEEFEEYEETREELSRLNKIHEDYSWLFLRLPSANVFSSSLSSVYLLPIATLPGKPLISFAQAFPPCLIPPYSLTTSIEH